MLVMLVGLLLVGCDRRDQSKEAIELGDKRVKLGAFREAVRAYESALDGTPKTAEVHYKLGNLYDDKLKSPLSAIHHYDRYLELSPSGGRAKEAKTGKADCEKRLNLTMKEGGLMTTAEAARLRNENESLRKSVAEMRNPKPTPAPRVPNPTEPDHLAPGARKHVVGKGETLASIAFKYYRNRSQASHIKDANFNQLGGKDVIKPGMTLIIPELPSRKRP
jgi:tetratricopeptide (TPR) repeat protein